jgi:hypothetical protein
MPKYVMLFTYANEAIERLTERSEDRWAQSSTDRPTSH